VVLELHCLLEAYVGTVSDGSVRAPRRLRLASVQIAVVSALRWAESRCADGRVGCV
jgi:hypothetical protein